MAREAAQTEEGANRLAAGKVEALPEPHTPNSEPLTLYPQT
jgi:hypothetical protein